MLDEEMRVIIAVPNHAMTWICGMLAVALSRGTVDGTCQKSRGCVALIVTILRDTDSVMRTRRCYFVCFRLC